LPAALLQPARWWNTCALGADGALTWILKSGANGTDISVSYTLGGYAKDGFEAASKAADRVLGEQIERLRKLIDA
jgi:hypothetical protein